MTDERKIQQLKARRRHVESAGWNRICCQLWRDLTEVTDPDAELMAAIEASGSASWLRSMRSSRNSALSRLRRRATSRSRIN